MYLKAVNGVVEAYPYSFNQLCKDNPSVSFPQNPTDALLADWNVYPVTVMPMPPYDGMTQTIVQDAPQLVEGVWAVAWLVQQLPLDQADANIRSYRDRLLYECDWTQLPDAPVDAATWAVYRQELRNVPQQEGFPYSVIWPTPPA